MNEVVYWMEGCRVFRLVCQEVYELNKMLREVDRELEGTLNEEVFRELEHKMFRKMDGEVFRLVSREVERAVYRKVRKK